MIEFTVFLGDLPETVKASVSLSQKQRLDVPTPCEEVEQLNVNRSRLNPGP